MHGTETSAPTHDRVHDHTAPAVNRRIRERLERLDGEWDIERALELLSSSLTLAGLGAGLSGRRGWLRLPVLVQAFFLQHALQGWCPPLPVLRRLGFRTQQEIEQERYALRALLQETSGPGGERRGAPVPVHVEPGPREQVPA